MDKRYLKNNHDEDVVEKRRNENYIKYKYLKCTYLWIKIQLAVIKYKYLKCTYRHDGGRGCRSVVLCGDHYCDVVGASTPRSFL
jgi:hypothetical protein